MLGKIINLHGIPFIFILIYLLTHLKLLAVLKYAVYSMMCLGSVMDINTSKALNIYFNINVNEIPHKLTILRYMYHLF